MADPLSVIASVIGVASAGIAVSTTLHNLVDRFGTAFDDIVVISSDLNGFSIVLREVGNKLNVPNSQRIASDLLIDGLRKLMETCQVLFVDIRRMIGKVYGDKMTQFKTKVRWIFREPKIRGIKATLECQKTTLNLMLQILLDDQSTFQRHILENLSREYDHKVKVIEEIAKENAALEKENAVLKGAERMPSLTSGMGAQSMVYLPGQGTSASGQLKRSATVMLTNIVPRRNHKKDNSPPYPELESNSPSQEAEILVKQSSRISTHSVYPFSAENQDPLEDPGMAIGVSTSTQLKSEIDLLVSEWTLKPEDRTQPGANPSILSLPPTLANSEDSNDTSISFAPPTLPRTATSFDHDGSDVPPPPSRQPIRNESWPESRSPIYQAKDPALYTNICSDNVKWPQTLDTNTREAYRLKSNLGNAGSSTKLSALETEHKNIISQIEIEELRIQAHEAKLKENAKINEDKLILAFRRDNESLEKANESLRSDIEKKLMQCEADEERRKTVEAELERCRQEYITRTRHQPSKSYEPLERQIQNMQDRLAHDRVELGNLSFVRKDLLQTLKQIQRDYEAQIAARKETFDKDIEKIRSETAPRSARAEYERLKELESKRAKVEGELSKLKVNLKKMDQNGSNTEWIPTVPTHTENNQSTNKYDMPPYPTHYMKDFKVPEWLNGDNTGAKRDSDDEELSEESGNNLPFEKSKVETPHWSTTSVKPRHVNLQTTATSSASPKLSKPPMPSVQSPNFAQAPSHWRFEAESQSPELSQRSPATTYFEHLTQGASPTAQESPREEVNAASSNTNPASAPVLPALMSRRPAWKPPLACEHGLDTLASIISQSTYQLLYFKASQDAYHFFLSDSPNPFYIIDLVPSDLTTNQTSTIQWTVLPKTWASSKALTANEYMFEEDLVGQMWIRKELNWHQILHLFDISCGILDNRLNFASRHVLAKRAEEREQWSTAQTTARLLSRLRGLKEMKILEELHGGFFSTK